jgi:hypothetical protein
MQQETEEDQEQYVKVCSKGTLGQGLRALLLYVLPQRKVQHNSINA